MSDTDKLMDILNSIGYEMVHEISPEEAHGAILDLFKSLLPEEKKRYGRPGKSDSWAHGHNECRSLLLAEIESLRK